MREDLSLRMKMVAGAGQGNGARKIRRRGGWRGPQPPLSAALATGGVKDRLAALDDSRNWAHL